MTLLLQVQTRNPNDGTVRTEQHVLADVPFSDVVRMIDDSITSQQHIIAKRVDGKYVTVHPKNVQMISIREDR